ncbi:MAG TPA: hypothetical protein VF523_17720 [Burkholderiales bacterium]
MHEQKGFVVAAILAALGASDFAVAQKDAAQKAQEGAIDHWIEYYKDEQRKSARDIPRQTADPSSATPVPVPQHDSASAPRQQSNPK